MTTLEDLSRLEAAATPFGWKAIHSDIRIFYPHNDHRVALASNTENAELIAALRNNARALIECARALEYYKDLKQEVRSLKYPDQVEFIDIGIMAREALAKLGVTRG